MAPGNCCCVTRLLEYRSTTRSRARSRHPGGPRVCAAARLTAGHPHGEALFPDRPLCEPPSFPNHPHSDRPLPDCPSLQAQMRPIHYTIRPSDPHAHLFDVSLRIADPQHDGQRLRLPVWIPGSYMIREFARHLEGVTATVRRSHRGHPQGDEEHLGLRQTARRRARHPGRLVPGLCLGPVGARRAPGREPRLLQRPQRLSRGGRKGGRGVQRRHPGTAQARASHAGASPPPCRSRPELARPSQWASAVTRRATTTN